MTAVTLFLGGKFLPAFVEVEGKDYVAFVPADVVEEGFQGPPMDGALVYVKFTGEGFDALEQFFGEAKAGVDG
jgi:hypothetical protein